MDKQKFEQVFAKFEAKCKKVVKADMGDPTDPAEPSEDQAPTLDEVVQDIYNDMFYLINNMRSYMYQQEDASYTKWQDHSKGHLPAMKGAAQMQNALKCLGVAGDYEVAKPTIYATKTNAGMKFEVDLNLPKNEKKA